jgi:HEAT repeat protein
MIRGGTLRHGAALVASWLGLASAALAQPYPPGTDDPSRRFRDARVGATVSEQAARLRDERPDIRLEAVKAMGESGDPQAVRHLVGAALDPDPRVASRAVDFLGRLRATEATEFLAERLFVKGTDPRLRLHILAALGRIGDSRAAGPILQFLAQSEDAELRAAGIYALGEIGDSTSRDKVAALVERETDPRLKALAQEALEKISGRRFEPTPRPTGAPDPFLSPLEP